ncbi:hypothetical protein ACROYT_G019432 [Oculina patagonica]
MPSAYQISSGFIWTAFKSVSLHVPLKLCLEDVLYCTVLQTVWTANKSSNRLSQRTRLGSTQSHFHLAIFHTDL